MLQELRVASSNNIKIFCLCVKHNSTKIQSAKVRPLKVMPKYAKIEINHKKTVDLKEHIFSGNMLQLSTVSLWQTPIKVFLKKSLLLSFLVCNIFLFPEIYFCSTSAKHCITFVILCQ